MLIQNDFRVFCIANCDEYSDRLICEGVTFIASDLQNKGLNPFSDLKYNLFLVKQYKKISPDFVFHYTVKPNIFGSVAASRLGLKSVAFVAGTGYPFLRKNFINLIVTVLYKIAGAKCTEMWFINSEDLNLFTTKNVVPRSKTRLLPGEGINLNYFMRDTLYPSGEKGFTFLLSSRLLWDKGVGIYIDAARVIKKKYPHARFQLLGFVDNVDSSSISKKQIDRWVKEGVIEYLGETDDVRKYLNGINCFVLPTYYKEGIPRTLLEASSLEIPVITTNTTGCREVVTNGYNGFLCEPKNVSELIECMDRIVNLDYNTLKKMGQNGRQKMKTEFDEEIVLEVYRKFLTAHLGNKEELLEVAV